MASIEITIPSFLLSLVWTATSFGGFSEFCLLALSSSTFFFDSADLAAASSALC